MNKYSYELPESILEFNIPIPNNIYADEVKPYEYGSFEQRLIDHFANGKKLPSFEGFIETRKVFQEKGQYTNLKYNPHPDSEYSKFWRNEKNKCLNGMTLNIDGEDWWIPGMLYWYWNFTPIHKTKIIGYNKRTGKAVADRTYDFPDIYDIDYFWYMYLYEARINGQHAAALKRRGLGFSFKASSIISYYFYHVPKSKSYAVADNWDYLIEKDGLLVKVSEHLAFIDEHTEFFQRRQVKNTDKYRRASFKETLEDGSVIEKGMWSEIIGISLEGNPNKVRGLRGQVIIYEEAGNMREFERAWEVSTSSIQQGNSVFGQLIAFGCVCAGTKVWTNDGRCINIEDLDYLDGIVGYNGKQSLQQDIIYIKDKAIKPCYKITLESGVELECSEDHPILVGKSGWGRTHNTDKRYLTFKRADEVTNDYQVAVIQSVPIFGNKNYSTARMIGLLIGDGYYASSMELAVADEEIAEYVRSICSYNVDKEFITKDGRQYGRYVLKNSEWKPLLEEVGIWGQTKKNKRLPINIHEFDKESLAELLGGYFDADGYVKYNIKEKKVHVILTSYVEELLKEVKCQLIKFGIHCSILEEHPKGGFGDKKDERHTIFRLYITRRDSVERFKNNIKLLCKHKNENLNKVKDSGKDKGKMTNGHFVDSFKGDYFKGMTGMNNVVMYSVIKIEPIGDKEVYNLTASITHTYLANNIVTHNTGGTVGEAAKTLEKMVLYPQQFNIYSIPNFWERGRINNQICFFAPDYVAKEGYIDEYGNSNIFDAIQAELHERNLRKGNITLLRQRMAEHPFTIDDAIMRVEGSPFDINLIREQLAEIETNSALRTGNRYGRMVLTNKGIGVDFEIDNNLKPILEFPTPKDYGTEGCIVIFELPVYDNDSNKPGKDWYVAGTDPVDLNLSDVGDTFSLASTYIINRFTRRIVAVYTARCKDKNDYYEQLRRLLIFYNCQTLYEANLIGLFDYFHRTKSLYLLAETPNLFKDMSMKVKGVGENIGIKSDPRGQIQAHCRDLTNKWTQEKIGEDDETGKIRYMINTIRDKAALQEMKDWFKDGNFDRVVALGFAILHLEEKTKIKIEKENSKKSILQDNFWNKIIPNQLPSISQRINKLPTNFYS